MSSVSSRVLLVAMVAGLSAGLAHAQPVPATLVVRVGDDVGDGMTISTLGEPYTDSTGRVGFVASRSMDSARGIWIGDGFVFWSTEYLPNTVTGGEGTMGISDGGNFLYSPSWNGEDAVATIHGLLLRGTDPAPNLPGQFATFNSRPRMAPDGTAWWIGGLANSAGGSTQGRVLWKCPDTTDVSSCVPLVRTGDLINGLPVGTTGIGFAFDYSDDSQQYIAFMLLGPTTANDGHIIVNGSTVAARESFPTGQGDNWQNFGGCVINNAGNYAFSGDTDGPAATDGFIAYNGQIIVREGSVLDGLTLSGNPGALSIDNSDNLAFIWQTNQGKALFYGPASDIASATALLRVGQEIDVDDDGVADYEVTDFNASFTIAPGLDIADVGLIYARAVLRVAGGTSSAQGIVGVARPGRTPPECPADWNNDGSVNSSDLSAFITSWLDSVQNSNLIADFNNDGAVNSSDLSAFITAWLDAVQNGC